MCYCKYISGLKLSVFFSWQAGASGKLLHREPDGGPATSRVRLGSRWRSPSALRHGAVRRPGPQPHQQRHVTLALVPRHRPASRPRDGRRPLRRQRQGTQPLISTARLHFTIRCPTFRYTPLHLSLSHYSSLYCVFQVNLAVQASLAY